MVKVRPTLPRKNSGTDLLERITAALLAVIDAENALRAARPVNRDYPENALTAAAKEHDARLGALDLVKLELQEIRTHLIEE